MIKYIQVYRKTYIGAKITNTLNVNLKYPVDLNDLLKDWNLMVPVNGYELFWYRLLCNQICYNIQDVFQNYMYPCNPITVIGIVTDCFTVEPVSCSMLTVPQSDSYWGD